jgi:prophage antirepressor-like protein
MSITIINKTFTFNNSNITVYGSIDKPYFVGNSIASLLGYERPRKAIYDHVKDKYKISVEDYEKQNNVTLNITNKSTILINEPALYMLISRSKLQEAELFQDFIYEQVLPSIRKTGSYTNNKPQNNQMILMSEFDLHTQIVKFIRRFFPQAIMTCTLGELQTTDKARIESKMKGYQSGISDIIIFNPNHHYNSLCIEFKNPNGKGVISDKQKKFMQDMMKNCKAKTIISDDYNYLVYEIMQYFSTVRIGCEFCNGKFKCQKSLDSHMKWFHRIKTV